MNDFDAVKKLFVTLYGEHASDEFYPTKFHTDREDFDLLVKQLDDDKFKLCLHRKLYRTKLIDTYYSIEELIVVLKIMMKSSLIQ
jgi:hypothetical protein